MPGIKGLQFDSGSMTGICVDLIVTRDDNFGGLMLNLHPTLDRLVTSYH
jgi:hypothetical protein